MLQADREAELKRELEEAREREAQLEKVKAETQARLDTLKEEYDESQHNLGNARLAWKALVRNLKFEEEKNREMEAEMKTLKVSARTDRLPLRPSLLRHLLPASCLGRCPLCPQRRLLSMLFVRAGEARSVRRS